MWILEIVNPIVYDWLDLFCSGCGYWRNERGPKILCAPARPANAAKRSGIVNYDIERGQSFQDEVIRVTRSDLRPQNRRCLHYISTHYDQRDRGSPTRPGARSLNGYLPNQLPGACLWGRNRRLCGRKSLLVTRMTSSLKL